MTRGRNSNKYTTGGRPVIPGQWMNVSGNIRMPGAETTENSRNDVYIARQEEINRNRRRLRGIPVRSAAVLLGIFGTVFAILILCRIGTKIRLDSEIKELRSQVINITEQLEVQRAEIAEARDSGRICYKAVQEMGMVNALGADTMYITLLGQTGYTVSEGGIPGVQTGTNMFY